MERELKRARLAGPSPSGRCFSPRLDLTDLARLLETVYSEKGLNIAVEAPDTRVPYDREDIMELAGNLADNACKWAVNRVRIRVEYAPQGLNISVEDDGRGCTAEEIEQLAQRGIRLDETKQGHGLGLAIVQDICNAYQGRLEFARAEKLGGLLVRAILPAAPA